MKMRRQKKIMELIKKQVVSTQEELAEALRSTGFIVTQATVSRDIKELRLVKIPTGEDTYRYAVPREKEKIRNEERLRRMLHESVLELDYSDNIVVLKTYPGNAQAVASLIDGAGWPEVIGSVAGDDTILLVTKDHQEKRPRGNVAALIQRLQNLNE